MPQKLFEPLKKLPYQLQHLHLIQKLHDLTLGRSTDAFGSYLSSVYGCPRSPCAMAYDPKLGLLAVGWATGLLKVYGAPGVVQTVQSQGDSVSHLCFLPEEGRLISLFANGCLALHELDPKCGRWSERCRLRVACLNEERITCFALGHGILYLGSSLGTVYQVAAKNGRMYLGDPTLTAFTISMLTDSLPADKRDILGAGSSVVNLEVQPDGFHLLIAYAGGCVVVAIPQPVPETGATETSPVKQTPAAPTVEQEVSTPAAEENSDAHVETAPSQEIMDQFTNGVTEQTTETKSTSQAHPDADASNASGAQVKDHTERRATLKIKEFTRSLRRNESSKHVPETEPPVTIPPAPRLSHVLLRDQAVEWATWRISSLGTQSDEITVAYGDGAYQIWPITAVPSDQELTEPLLVSKREPPTTPYGPLPCGPIKKILQNPGFTGGILTAFSGGLPRAEFNDRHAVTVLQDQEHHVCFQFGSEVKDFIFIPDKYTVTHDSASVESPTSEMRPPQCVSALVVLTDRELVVIDLRQPNWPTFASPYLNCLDISPVTAVNHLSKISTTLLDRLFAHAKYEYEVSLSKWPIWGGECGSDYVDFARNDDNDVLLLGHADGSVSLVHISRGDSLCRLGTFHTDILFNLTDSPDAGKYGSIEVETWPPFRRVGDCALWHSDRLDSRLAVTQLASTVSEDSLTIVVGGAAGQVSIWSMPEQSAFVKVGFEPDVAQVHIDLTEHGVEHTKYIWKGAPLLRPFEGVAQHFGTAATSFSPCALLQLNPPAPITSLALQPFWNLLAIGSPHGFAVVDLLAKSTVYSDFLFAKSDSVVTHKLGRQANAFVNRGRQLTATMRQSFRRLKHLRTSTTGPTKVTDETQETQHAQPQDQPTDSTTPVETATTVIGESAPASDTATPEVKDQPAGDSDTVPDVPVDTATEDVPEPISIPDEFGPSTVRSLLFVDTYVASPVTATVQQSVAPSTRTPSLWVGTANGCALAHSLSWDGVSGPVIIQLHKELQLQHRAPVIGLCVVDASTRSPVLSSQRIRTNLEPENKPAEESEPKPEAQEEQTSVNTEAESAAHSLSAPDSHQLLVCSEEQVKLFQLPSLRALHKHKFIERIRLPGHLSGNVSFSGSSPGAEIQPKQERENDESAETVAKEEPAAVTVPDSKSAPPSQSSRRKLTAFGVQSFSRGTGDQLKVEWNVIVTRCDGQTVILSLPNLRKIFKVKSYVDASTSPVACVAPPSYANVVLWASEGQLLATELSFFPKLTSLALLTPGTPLPLPATIVLPDWARPRPSTCEEHEEKPVETAPLDDAVTSGLAMASTDVPVQNGTSDIPADSEAVPSELPDKSYPSAVSHAGDMTIDSIKEYLNGDGAVTVKTVETTSEKRTLVDGGHVTITLRETEQVDGKVTKDDLLKFSTEETSSVVTSGVA